MANENNGEIQNVEGVKKRKLTKYIIIAAIVIIIGILLYNYGTAQKRAYEKLYEACVEIQSSGLIDNDLVYGDIHIDIWGKNIYMYQYFHDMNYHGELFELLQRKLGEDFDTELFPDASGKFEMVVTQKGVVKLEEP